MTYDFLETLYRDLLSITKGLVIKRVDLAMLGETVETVRRFDEYLAAVNGSYSFYTFRDYQVSVLQEFYDDATARLYSNDTKLIPEADRQKVAAAQAAYCADNYVELNNYYRVLNGKPPLSGPSSKYIYVTAYYDIPIDLPVHEMPYEMIGKLEARGMLDKLKMDYPDFEYLNYLGSNSIDIITARLARPFEIIRIGDTTNPHVTSIFRREYYLARKYILRNYYNSSQVNNKELYEPIIGMMILTTAIRNSLVPTDDDYLNFEEILDAILDSYGFLKYFKKFPFTYKKRLVMALDNLLKIKGTDQVLVDVCKIFNPEELIANRYYLMKTYNLNTDGTPLNTGDPKIDYTMQFVKASITDHDISTSEENLTPYRTVVDSDFLWQLNDEETIKALNQDFNLMMTKYVDVEAAYSVSAVVFEVCTFLNFLLNSRFSIQKHYVTNQYATGSKSSLFATIVMVLAAMAKRSGYDGNIVYDAMTIAEVWGSSPYPNEELEKPMDERYQYNDRYRDNIIWKFNYDSIDVDAVIAEVIEKYELNIDVYDDLIPGYTEIMLAQRPGDMSEIGTLLSIYVSNRDLYDAILQEMQTTEDVRKYIALSNIKDALYTSAMTREAFQMSNGEAASTYYEMLQDVDYKLAEKLDATEDADELTNLIVYLLEKLEEYFKSDELKYLFMNTPTMYSSLINKYISTAINVFKASTVQLRNVNVFFYLGDENPIRVISDLKREYTRHFDEYIHVVDELGTTKHVYLEDYIYVGDKVYWEYNQGK